MEGTSLWLQNLPDRAIELLESTRANLLKSRDSALLSSCTIQLSAAYWVKGEYGISRRMALDALVAAQRAGSKYFEAQALVNHARMVRQQCRWTEAEDALREALSIHEALECSHQIVHALRGLAIGEWRRGRLDQAWALSEQCATRAGASGQGILISMASLTQGTIQLHRGAYHEVLGIAAATPGWDVRHGASRAAILALEYKGDALLELKDVAAALEAFDAAAERTLVAAPKGDIAAEIRRRRAECLYLLGRHEGAYAEAREGLKHCKELGERYEEAATYRIMALSAAAVGKPDEAKKWFDEGFALYDDIETPYEWGKLWMGYGDWLLGPHAGAYADRRGAWEAYHAARDHFERMGAEGKLAEVSAKLERMVNPRAETTHGQVADAEDARSPHTPRRPRRSTELERQSAWAHETFGLVTRNKAMLALLDDVGKLAPSDTPILVLGESGTGKELIARGIHALSLRKGQFMAINAGALPREIIESELFGHVAGSFTGATRDKPGMFEVCEHGTVFLDEIAEMSVELQSRLLRFLETGEVRRVGANAISAVDTRIIAATNRERAALERSDGFRLDLYYRLAHAVISLPPLRSRGDDVELLALHFLEDACRSARRQVRLSPASVRRMGAYSWPGNVRQLRAVIKRVVLLSAEGHEVTPEDLQLENAEVPTTLIGELEQAERRRVAEVLAQTRGSRTEAAKMLGMPRTTLINKIRRYGLG